MDRFLRSHIDDHRCEIFIREISEKIVRHEREKRSAIMANALSQGAHKHRIAPLPRPYSGSGDMFGATMRLGGGTPASSFENSNPPNFLPDIGSNGRLEKSTSEWHAQHCSTPSTRYLPRSKRSCVRGMTSISSTDWLAVAVVVGAACWPDEPHSPTMPMRRRGSPAYTALAFFCTCFAPKLRLRSLRQRPGTHDNGEPMKRR